MKCPVCKAECGDNSVCVECGFDGLNPVFLSKEEGELWQKTVVDACRSVWKKARHLDDFIIQDGILKKYIGSGAICIEIPSGVTEVGDEAFQKHHNQYNADIENLTHSIAITVNEVLGRCPVIRFLIIPASVKRIGKSAFLECAIQSVFFHDGLETIDDFAFCNTSIKSLTMPDGLKTIGASAFEGCFQLSLERPRLPDSVTEIGDRAFLDCKINEVVIPASIEKIGFQAISAQFIYCDALSKPCGWDDEWFDRYNGWYDEVFVLWGGEWHYEDGEPVPNG